MCGRKSILLKKGARMQSILSMCDRNEECCPLLLEVLSTSLGTMDAPEKTIATLATIYGMLIHVDL